MPMDEKRYESWIKAVRETIWTEMWPHVEEIERTGRIPDAEFIPMFARHGLWGALVPQDHGGLGLCFGFERTLDVLAAMLDEPFAARALRHLELRDILNVVGRSTGAIDDLGAFRGEGSINDLKSLTVQLALQLGQYGVTDICDFIQDDLRHDDLHSGLGDGGERTRLHCQSQ